MSRMISFKTLASVAAGVILSAVFTAGSLFATELSGDYVITVTNDFPAPFVFTGDANVTIAAGVYIDVGTMTNDGHTVTFNFEPESQVQMRWLQSLNGASTKFNFKGGRFRDAGTWNSDWFKTPGGCTVELASVDGNPIHFTHPSTGPWKIFNSGDGRVFTSGTGLFLVQAVYVSGQTTRLMNLRNVPGTNYLHTGGTRFRGLSDTATGLIYAEGANNLLPPGLIELGQSGAAGGAILNLHGYTHTAEQLVGYGTSFITNYVVWTGVLEFSADGSILDCPVYGNVQIEKSGASSTLTVKKGPVPTLWAKAGTTLVKPDTAGTVVKVGSLRVFGDTTLTVDGGILEADTFEAGPNATINCVNGGTLRLPAAAGTTNYVDADGWDIDVYEKTGAGTTVLGSDAAVTLGDVRVAAGTLTFGEIGSTNRFWRVSFKRSNAGTKLAIGPFRLYDRSLNLTDGAGLNSFDESIYEDMSTNSITASQLAAMQLLCSRSDYDLIGGDATHRHRKPAVMFWGSTVDSCMFDKTPYPATNDPSTWVVMTYRIPDTYAATYGYDVKSQWEGVTYHPGTWSLESSPDGQDGTWTVMDEQSGQQALNGQTWYHGGNSAAPGVHTAAPYVLKSVCPGGGFDPSADVQVASGATLDCALVPGGQEISKLTVDVSTGGGTLKNVRLAASGTLYLTNVINPSALAGYVVPVSFDGVADTANARTWTLYVNGEPSDRHVAWGDNGLFIPTVGTMISVF
ncbi:MAG: hypothetical protein GX565_15955 [Lentisphaerae bacterium]|nr:hypothetical protein [Lentisphaerota bacterium]